MAGESQLNIFKESFCLVIFRPRHFWDCKWKSRCLDTHFHSMSWVPLQSFVTIQSSSAWMHLPVFSWTMVNGSLPESRWTVKERHFSSLNYVVSAPSSLLAPLACSHLLSLVTWKVPAQSSRVAVPEKAVSTEWDKAMGSAVGVPGFIGCLCYLEVM